jgi:hypothetical protein
MLESDAETQPTPMSKFSAAILLFQLSITDNHISGTRERRLIFEDSTHSSTFEYKLSLVNIANPTKAPKRIEMII